jgi:hypothetical protein
LGVLINGGVEVGECGPDLAVNVPAFSLGDQIYLFYIEF